MEYRSRLPGEPSPDHPGVPTGRLGHRAGLKTVGGIFRRFFCGLPALPAGCSDPGVGASSTGKHRSPQTAPRLRGPNLGSIEPGRSPEVMLEHRKTVMNLHATEGVVAPKARGSSGGSAADAEGTSTP